MNTTLVPVGDAIELTGIGDHMVIATDPLNGCADTVIVTLTFNGLPQGFIEDKFALVSENCDENDPIYCLKDINWLDIDQYEITVNNEPFDGPLGTCNYDYNHAYSYFTVPGLANSGPYALDSWMVNGVSYNGTFNNPSELVSLMNQIDPRGDWKLDAAMFTIISEGNIHDYYGNLHITQQRTSSMANLELNTNYVPNDLAITLDPGMNELVFERLSDGMLDTVTVGVACISPDYISNTIKVGQIDTVCLDYSELLGNVVGIDNVCVDFEGAAEFTMMDGTNCFTCRGRYVGTTEACVIVCDDYGLCDTTYVNVRVVPDIKTVAITDTARTSKSDMVVVNPAGNDIFNGTVSGVFVKDPPRYGTAYVNSDLTISYVPHPEYCDKNLPDYFGYEICTPEGGCDVGMVYIFVDCGKLVVYNGFSPNGDGVNETLKIDGLEEFPDHKLTVFNRWGIKVYEAQNYQNDWNGTWKGEGLPDGTYFFLLDDGNGNVSNGYIEIQR
ncbi:MAG: gliding motility-associated C-terminal domain-containing protein [Saprospiraceae bacterium]